MLVVGNVTNVVLVLRYGQRKATKNNNRKTRERLWWLLLVDSRL
jgi:hypothetical protein